MKNPVYEQIQARKVKAKLRMLQHAKRLSGSVSQTCRFFGVCRAFYYIWKKRYEENGLAGLRDLPRRPHHIKFHIPPEIVSLILRIREERRYGAVRVRCVVSAYVATAGAAGMMTLCVWQADEGPTLRKMKGSSIERRRKIHQYKRIRPDELQTIVSIQGISAPRANVSSSVRQERQSQIGMPPHFRKKSPRPKEGL
jgi:transposase-like protein